MGNLSQLEDLMYILNNVGSDVTGIPADYWYVVSEKYYTLLAEEIFSYDNRYMEVVATDALETIMGRFEGMRVPDCVHVFWKISGALASPEVVEWYKGLEGLNETP